jgi:hypothetical protein
MLGHARPYKWLAGQSLKVAKIVHFDHVSTTLPSPSIPD